MFSKTQLSKFHRSPSPIQSADIVWVDILFHTLLFQSCCVNRNKDESSVVLWLLSWFGFCIKQGKECERCQSEKEGSKLREVEWFPGVRHRAVSARFPSKIVCVLGRTLAAKEVPRRTNYVLLCICVQKDTQFILCFGEWPINASLMQHWHNGALFRSR